MDVPLFAGRLGVSIQSMENPAFAAYAEMIRMAVSKNFCMGINLSSQYWIDLRSGKKKYTEREELNYRPEYQLAGFIITLNKSVGLRSYFPDSGKHRPPYY